MYLHALTFKLPSKTDHFFFFEKEEFLKNGYGYDFETFTNGFLIKNCIRISCHQKTKFFFPKHEFIHGVYIVIKA